MPRCQIVEWKGVNPAIFWFNWRRIRIIIVSASSAFTDAHIGVEAYAPRHSHILHPNGESMPRETVTPTGVERLMGPEDVIQSRTDTRGNITECNELFVDYSGYSAKELLGSPHNIVRHPEMPRALFKLMWREIQAQREIFLFVKNLAKDGRHYWVVAQVMPEIARGEIVGFHSFRRCPNRRAVETFEALYRRMYNVERNVGGNAGMDASLKLLEDSIKAMGAGYDALVYAHPEA